MNRASPIWALLVGGFVALLLFGTIGGIGTLVGFGPEVGVVIAAGIGALVAGAAYVRARQSTEDTEQSNGKTERHDVWDAIPSWQYDGRHVESGGFTRGEQEDAIDDVQETASKKLDQLDDQR